MKLFSDWMTELDEGIRMRKQLVPHPKQMELPFKKDKVAPVAHADIDRWLKSVDGLAKDLKDLQAAKSKAKDKMSQIGQKFKPDSDKPDSSDKPEKDIEKEKKDNDTGIERKTVKRPRTAANREVRQPARPEERNDDDRPERPAKPEVKQSRPDIGEDEE